MKTDLLFSSVPFIASEKVTLTQITDLDLDGLWEILGDDDNFRFTPTAAFSSKGEMTERLRENARLFRGRKQVTLGIHSDLNQLLGLFQISEIDPAISGVTVSFMLRGDSTGFGYASSALRAVSKYLFDTVEVNRIQAYVLPINYRGVLVLERCGFVKEGTIREGFNWPDKGIVDLALYSLLPSDYRRSLSEGKKKEKTGYYL